MNKTRLTAAIAGALFAAVALVPAVGHAGDHSRTAVSIGYHDSGGGYYGGPRYNRHHHEYHPSYGRARVYYAPAYYPAPVYYQPYYPSYYPAPSYYYGPGGNWSIDLHYFFRD